MSFNANMPEDVSLNRFLSIGLLLVAAVASPLQAAETSPSVPALIEQLGHPIYAERRDARRQIESLGLRAFDTLRKTTEHPDPEVAEASRQLLREVIGTWTWKQDSPDVRRLLDGFGDGLIEDRLRCVQGLANLPLEEGVPALVRIARFDASELVARTAAAALLESDDFKIEPAHAQAVRQAVIELNDRYGAGERSAAKWLDLAIADSPAAAAWARYADDLASAVDRHQANATAELVAVLYRQQLRDALREENAATAEEAIDALIGLEPTNSGRLLSQSFQWITDAGKESVVDELSEAYSDRLQDKRGLYGLAQLAKRFGRKEKADELAAAALQASATVDGGSTAETLYGPRLLIASNLRRRGHPSWSIAEYEATIEATPEGVDNDLNPIGLIARWQLADLHYDAADYNAAAEALGAMVAQTTKSQATRDQYENFPQVSYGILPRLGELVSHERLNAALAAREAGESEAEMTALRRSISKDPDNADVAIAMFHVKNPTPAFEQQTERIVRTMRQTFEKRIWDWEQSEDADEGNGQYRSGLYNQWAWLVSNTEGDFDKAVRYSQRSLEILPDQAGCLDTLGRCLFSAGRIDEAIEVQQRAVDQQPWMKVMQRQLAEFKAAKPSR